MKTTIIIDEAQKLNKEDIDYILNKYEFNTSEESYNSSVMVNMLKNRTTTQ
jgi:hypothetical protein